MPADDLTPEDELLREFQRPSAVNRTADDGPTPPVNYREQHLYRALRAIAKGDIKAARIRRYADVAMSQWRSWRFREGAMHAE